MKKTKICFCVMAALMMNFSMVGCAGSGADNNGSADESKTESETKTSAEAEKKKADNTMNIKIGDQSFTATLVDNSSVDALKKLLAKGPITIKMSDYENMEKVGGLGSTLPRNDEQITTEPGDLILYQGNAFVIYYAPNSWNFTRLGKIDGATKEKLKEALGSGDVTVTLSLD